MSVPGDATLHDEERAHQDEDILNQQSQMSEPPRTEWDILRAHLKENPRDADSWLRLVDVAEESKNYEKINETYEALLEAFPNTVSDST